MEPMLHPGDLAVARTEASYGVGDLVVYHVDYGLVIHRITSGDAVTGWTTQGDNRPKPDPWVVHNDAIVGKYSFEVPAFGSYLAWVNRNAMLFGASCAAVALLAYLPWHRRRLAPVLRDALSTATREPRRGGRSNLEYGVLGISAIASIAAIALIGLLGTSHQLASLQGAIAFGALAWGGGFTVYLAYRLYDGRGLAEPMKSVYALSGRLRAVDTLPVVDLEPERVSSALELRALAERHRLPVLHRVDRSTDGHEFMLITETRGSFTWAPARSHESEG